MFIFVEQLTGFFVSILSLTVDIEKIIKNSTSKKQHIQFIINLLNVILI